MTEGEVHQFADIVVGVAGNKAQGCRDEHPDPPAGRQLFDEGPILVMWPGLVPPDWQLPRYVLADAVRSAEVFLKPLGIVLGCSLYSIKLVHVG